MLMTYRPTNSIISPTTTHHSIRTLITVIGSESPADVAGGGGGGGTGIGEAVKKGTANLEPSGANVGSLLEQLKPELPDASAYIITTNVAGFTNLGSSGFVGGTFTVIVPDMEDVSTEVAEAVRPVHEHILNPETGCTESTVMSAVGLRPEMANELTKKATQYKRESHGLRSGQVQPNTLTLSLAPDPLTLTLSLALTLALALTLTLSLTLSLTLLP